MSVFHHDMFDDSEKMILEDDDEEKFFVRAAPRGFGKSRIISVVLPLWCICYKYRKNIMLIADTGPQVKEYISTIKTELEENAKLREDFGDLTGNRKWSEDEIITGNSIRVIGKSSGQSLRGSSWNNIRPELIVLDDLENDENVETDNQREKLKNWFMKVLMPIGNDRTCFLYVGSVLHYESLLYKILTNPEFSNWDRKLYKAIYEFSNSELWFEWQRIFTDLSNENASREAKQFYLANKEEMLKGVSLLWPEWHKESYYDLMIKKLQDDDSFNSEYQNNPMTEETRTFKEQWIKGNYYVTTPKIKHIYGAVDLSLGKTRTADTSAIIFVGQGIDNYFYILEADIERRTPDKIINDIIGYIIKYGSSLDGFVVETNVFQEFFATTIKQICLDMGLHVNWIERKNVAGESKILRIRSLAPKIRLGYLKFNQQHRALETQLKDFPKGHDDGPDALEMCINQFMGLTNKVLITSLNKGNSPRMKSMEKIVRRWFR